MFENSHTQSKRTHKQNYLKPKSGLLPAARQAQIFLTKSFITLLRLSDQSPG